MGRVLILSNTRIPANANAMAKSSVWTEPNFATFVGASIWE